MNNFREGLDSLTLACKANPQAFHGFLEQSAVLFQTAGYDMETVLLTGIAQAFQTEEPERVLEYLKRSVPLLSLLNAASRYASRMEDPGKFTWEEFFAHLISK